MGDAILTINMPPYGYDCAMCGIYSTDGYAVPWYEEPVSEEQSEGCYRCVCKPCYDELENQDD